MSQISKRRIARKYAETKKRRSRIFIICLVAAVALIATAIVLRRPKQPTAGSTFTSAEAAPLYARLDAIIDQARVGVSGEPDAENLLRDFATSAIVGKMSSFGQVVFAPRHPVPKNTAALVVFVAKSELEFVPEQMPSPFMFAPAIQAVVFADLEPMSNETLAVVLLHEIFHWQTFLRNGRKMNTEPYSNARLEEEVLAHELENRAVLRLTHGAFQKAINSALADDDLSKKNQSGFRVLTPTGTARVLAAWPNLPQSRLETNSRASNAAIAFRFAQIPDQSERIRAYAEIRRESVNQDIRE